ncbi:MAG: glycosyltransferase [Bacteroidales bacterium]|nr:glycosyltransferase [Bacteroidales bacterium]
MKSKIKFFYKQFFKNGYNKNVLSYYKKFLDASQIITVSDHSKRSLLSFFPEVSSQRIQVLYSPLIYYGKESKSDTIAKLSLAPRKYFLVLSGSIWTKNSIRAVRAFDELISDRHDLAGIKMIITGVSKLIYKIKNQQNFIFTSYLDRDTLEDLYQNALALVYPTLNEGFGYPPLEALKYGVPVLVSEIGPVPEVCGNAAYYFDPHSEDEIKNSLSSAILNPGLFSDKNIQSRISRYTLIKEKQQSDLDKMIKILIGDQ